jgi:VCBS repeat-containing protein
VGLQNAVAEVVAAPDHAARAPLDASFDLASNLASLAAFPDSVAEMTPTGQGLGQGFGMAGVSTDTLQDWIDSAMSGGSFHFSALDSDAPTVSVSHSADTSPDAAPDNFPVLADGSTGSADTFDAHGFFAPSDSSEIVTATIPTQQAVSNWSYSAPLQDCSASASNPPISVPTAQFNAPQLALSTPAAATELAWVGDIGSGLITGGSHTGSGTSSSGGSGGTPVHAASGTASSGFVINVVYDSSVANAPSGFTAAVAAVVNYYESVITTPVTITIDVGYGEIAGQSLGSGALGESETYLTSVSYAALQSALVKNANAIGDTAAAASLPSASPVSGQFWVSTAEAKALGLAGASTSVDGYVGFASNANFAYSEASGVGASQYDFYSVVAHEISEVMGRQVMVGESFAGTTGYEPLDLFHYSAAGVRDFSGTTAGYASANGGSTSLDAFNTNPGGDFGDWASSAGNDAFNAYANPGVVNAVSASDLALLGLLGWDPATTSSTPAPTPPPTATAPVVAIRLATDTGVSATDNITSNDALTGTADPNATVTLTIGSHVIGTATAGSTGAWSFTPSGLTSGQYTVTASETNSAGLTGSAALTFTYEAAAPVVVSDTASNTGTLTAGQAVMLSLNMSEAVLVTGGVPTLALNDGGTATYDAAHSTATSLAFDYTPTSGQYTSALSVTGLTLHGATIIDLAGNTAITTGAISNVSNLAVDATTPVASPDYSHDALGGSMSASAKSGVLANDHDADTADVLSVNAVNGAAVGVGHAVAGAFGNLTLNSDGSYAYTNTNTAAVKAAGGVVEDSFSYTVSNGHGGTATSTLSVLITSPGETYSVAKAGGTLNGGPAGSVLDGTAGNATLNAGNSGAQWLVGAAGDTLKAGSSTDTFVFGPNFGAETINNFNTAHDTIELPQSVFANFAALAADMHTVGGNAVLELDAHDIITISHVAAVNLTAQNFHFIA